MKTYRTKNGYYYKEYQNGKKKRISEEDYIKLKKTSTIKKKTLVKKKTLTVKKKTPVKKKATTVKKKKQKGGKRSCDECSADLVLESHKPIYGRQCPLNQISTNQYEQETQCQHVQNTQQCSKKPGVFGIGRSGVSECRMCGHMFCSHHIAQTASYGKIKEGIDYYMPGKHPILKSGILKSGNKVLQNFKWMWKDAYILDIEILRNAAKVNPLRWGPISELPSNNENKPVILKNNRINSFEVFNSPKELFVDIQRKLLTDTTDLKICDNCKQKIEDIPIQENLALKAETYTLNLLKQVNYNRDRFIRDKNILYTNIGQTAPENTNTFRNSINKIIRKRKIALIQKYLKIVDWNIYNFYNTGVVKACYNEIEGNKIMSNINISEVLNQNAVRQYQSELDNSFVIHIYKEHIALYDEFVPIWNEKGRICQICLENDHSHHCRWCGLSVCDKCVLIIEDDKAKHSRLVIKSRKSTNYFCKDFCAKEGLKNIFESKIKQDLLKHPEIDIFLKDSFLKNRYTTNNSELSKRLLKKIFSNNSNKLLNSEVRKTELNNSILILPRFDDISILESVTTYKDHPIYKEFYIALRELYAKFLKYKFENNLQSELTRFQTRSILESFQENVLAVCGFLKQERSLLSKITAEYFGNPEIIFSFDEQINALKNLTVSYFECPVLFNQIFDPHTSRSSFFQSLFVDETTRNGISIGQLKYKRIISGPLYYYRNANSTNRILNHNKTQKFTAAIQKLNEEIIQEAQKIDMYRSTNLSITNERALLHLAKSQDIIMQCSAKRREFELALILFSEPENAQEIMKHLREQRESTANSPLSYNDLFKTNTGEDIIFSNSFGNDYYGSPDGICNLSSALTRLFKVIDTFLIDNPSRYYDILLELQNIRNPDKLKKKFKYIMENLQLELHSKFHELPTESNTLYSKGIRLAKSITSQLSTISVLKDYKHLFDHNNSITITLK